MNIYQYDIRLEYIWYLVWDRVRYIQSGIDGSEYRYLGTGFNIQTLVRTSTSTLHIPLGPSRVCTSRVTALLHN